MTTIHYIPPKLEAIPALRDSMICCFPFEEKRPLQGVAGLLDWRLLGRLSQLHMSRFFTAERAQQLLVLPGNRLPVNYMVLIGAGSSASFSTAVFHELLGGMLDCARKLGTSHIMMTLPGRDENLISGEDAVRCFFDGIPALLHYESEFSFTIIDTFETQQYIDTEAERYRLKNVLLAPADRL